MRTTILSKVLIVLLCSVSYITTHAQGLSLSFNLSETDTLANMIADSKKYNIESLTLSGYVNDVNTKYIQELNQKGKLESLDLSNIEYISANGQHKLVAQKEFIRGNKLVSSNNYESYFEGLVEFLTEYGYPNANSINQDALGGEFWKLVVTIEDNISETSVIRSFSGMKGFFIKYGNFNYDKTIQDNYCVLMPKRIFDICSFSRFVVPKHLETLGGADCSYRVKSCDEYIVGANVSIIGDNAFKDSRIGELLLCSTITEIKAGAFENTSGIVSSDILSNVTFIGDNAFKNSTCLNGGDVNLNLHVLSIGNSAFQNSKLNYDITLNSVKELGDSAFMESSIKSIEIGTKLELIGDKTFANCSDLQMFTGGSNISSIGEKAFYGCTKLKEFKSSDVLVTIGNEAFANNDALTSFSIPDATQTIGYNALANSGLKDLHIGVNINFRRDITSGCYNLESYSVSDNHKKLRSVNGVLLSKEGTILVEYPYGKKEPIYEVDNKVIEIADSAFYNVNKLGSLVISESVEMMGKDAFANSSICEIKLLPSTTPKVTNNMSGLDQSLVRLYVHDKDYSTYYIANYWGDFKNIFTLEKAVSTDNIINVEKAGTLPEYIGFCNQFKYNTLRISGYLNSDDVRYLREMAGKDVRGSQTAGVLSDLDFSQASIIAGGEYYYIKNDYSSGKLKTADNVIGESMFEGCNFKSLAISETTTQIGNKALYGCPLTTFRIPATTKELNPNSFWGMNTLKELIVDQSNNNYQTQNGVLFTKDGKTLLLYPYAKEGERYSTPESTTRIGEQAFGGSNLNVVIINEGLTEIGTLAFDHLGSLEGISLPGTLEKIGHRAFWGCKKLLNIFCKAYYPPTLKYDSYSYYGQPYNNFSDKTYENAVLMVPKKTEVYNRYINRAGWKLFNNIIESDSWISGIQTINNNANKNVIKRYDINGHVINNPSRGINIIKMSDGKTKKIIVK